jgi:RHS repeat-associated protein
LLVLRNTLTGPALTTKIRQKGSTSNTTYYFSQDHLGSTTALTGTTGKLVERINYDSYGNSTGSTRTRYGFTGRERDQVTAMLYYRARFYDPQLGRFITEDPVGFAGGRNWYAYVSNDPANLTDPAGLWETDAHNEIIDQAFARCLSGGQRAQLKDSSRWMDRLDNQGAENAYQHGMSAQWETPDFARNAANKWIGDRQGAARKAFPNGCKDGYGKIPWNALWEFGKALHTLTDMTSPSHVGFQVWHDPPFPTGNLLDIARYELYGAYAGIHHFRETRGDLLGDPSRLQMIKKMARDEFAKTFGDCGCCVD